MAALLRRLRITPRLIRRLSVEATADTSTLFNLSNENENSNEKSDENSNPVAPAAASSTLRPYQLECIESSLGAVDEGHRRIAVSMPVGSGKTVVFSNLIPRIQPQLPTAHKSLVLAHREELISQAYRQIVRHCPSARVTIDKANHKPDMSADIIVASVQTLGRTSDMRRLAYDPTQFKCIIIDEAHHASASTYQRILSHMGAFTDNSHMIVWGCSATLRRHDGVSLHPTFEKIVYHKPITDMISDRWLTDVRVVPIETKHSMPTIPTRPDSKDFSISKLSDAINVDSRNQMVVKVYLEEAIKLGRKSTLVFAADIEHIKCLVEAFRSAGVRAEGLSSDVSGFERSMILADFASGKLPVLVNCGILTEGVDIPRVDCIMLTRPTRSASLMQQMIGRGMRLFEGKDYCAVFDFIDHFSSKRTSLVTVPTLLGLKSTFDCQGQSINKIVSDLNQIGLDGNSTFDPNSYSDVEAYLRLVKKRAPSRSTNDKDGGSSKDTNNETDDDDMDDDAKKAAIETIRYEARPFLNPFSINQLKEDNLSLSKISKLIWVHVGECRWVLMLGQHVVIVVEKGSDGIYTAKRVIHMKRKSAHFKSKKNIDIPATQGDTLMHTIHAVDTYLLNTFGPHFLAKWSRGSRWRYEKPSDQQLSFARSIGIDINSERKHLTKGYLSDLICRKMHGATAAAEKSAKRMKELEKRRSKEHGFASGLDSM